jgi:CheY-specific phosphatase CheX
MIEAPPEVQKVVEAFASEACVSLFHAYEVSLTAVDAEAPLAFPIVLTGVIGFTGPGLRGTCIVASTEGPLRQSNPTDGSLRDWIAELANQLVGRVKNHLLRGGADVYVTTPVVMRGEHLAPLPRFVLKPQAFATPEGGRVFLWVEVEAKPDFELSEVRQSSAPVAEGDALLF